MNLKKMREFVKLLQKRKDKDYDNIIVATGIKGSGKSTFLYHLGNEYMKQLGRKFDLQNSVVYSDSFDEVFDKINKAKDGDYLWFDEGGRLILGEDWNSARSKRLKKMFSEIRTKHLCIGFAMPFSFTRIDKKYRESLINFWAWIPRRGFSLIFEPVIHPTYSGFMEEYFNKIKSIPWSKTLNENIENFFYNSFKKFSSFLDVLSFTEIPKDKFKEYLRLRDEAVYKLPDDDTMQEKLRFSDKAFIKLVETLSQDKNKSISQVLKDISQSIDANPESLRATYYNIKKRYEAEV